MEFEDHGAPLMPNSEDADGLRVRKCRHAVNHAHADRHLGRLRINPARQEAIARGRFEPHWNKSLANPFDSQWESYFEQRLGLGMLDSLKGPDTANPVVAGSGPLLSALPSDDHEIQWLASLPRGS